MAFGLTGVGAVAVGASDADIIVAEGLMAVEVFGSCGNARGLATTSWVAAASRVASVRICILQALGMGVGRSHEVCA